MERGYKSFACSALMNNPMSKIKMTTESAGAYRFLVQIDLPLRPGRHRNYHFRNFLPKKCLPAVHHFGASIGETAGHVIRREAFHMHG